MTRQFLTSPGEKTVCADRDDRGGVLLTGRDEQQVEINAEMWAQLQRLMAEPAVSVTLRQPIRLDARMSSNLVSLGDSEFSPAALDIAQMPLADVQRMRELDLRASEVLASGGHSGTVLGNQLSEPMGNARTSAGSLLGQVVVGDAGGSPILGSLVALARQERVIGAAAQDDELLAGLGRDDLGGHGGVLSLVDIAAVANREDLNGVGRFDEDGPVVADAKAGAGATNEGLRAARTRLSVAFQLRQDIQPHLLRQLAEALQGGGGVGQRLHCDNIAELGDIGKGICDNSRYYFGAAGSPSPRQSPTAERDARA